MADDNGSGTQQQGSGPAAAAPGDKGGAPAQQQAPAAAPASTISAAEHAAIVAERDKLKADAEKAARSRMTAEEAAKAEAQDARTRAEKAEAELLKYRIGSEKSVPSHLLKFVTGSTQQELEASADEVLSAFGAAAGNSNSAQQKNPLNGGTPQQRLQSGLDGPAGTPQETDPAKLGQMIPRRH